MSANGVSKSQAAVTVSLESLKDGSVTFKELETAFGPDSLGIIVVKDLPSNFIELRRTLLSYSSYLANLSDEQLAKLERPEAKWLVGWSCGKETLKSGQFDTLKGSYYVNCSPSFSDSNSRLTLEDKYPGFSEYTAENVWPTEDVLPGFQAAFEELCLLIIRVATLVARACDQYAQANIEGYMPGYLEHVVKTSMVSKARLLHYFPMEQEAASGGDEDDWCATHLDHGCLTGLTSAMFVDEDKSSPHLEGEFKTLSELDASPDPKAGLYIRSRTGETVKVGVPRDCLAFQTGEALEIITKGKFKAVPHFVRGAAPTQGGGKIARNTLAVFTQPNLWELVDEKRDFAAFAKEIVERNH